MKTHPMGHTLIYCFWFSPTPSPQWQRRKEQIGTPFKVWKKILYRCYEVLNCVWLYFRNNKFTKNKIKTIPKLTRNIEMNDLAWISWSGWPTWIGLYLRMHEFKIAWSTWIKSVHLHDKLPPYTIIWVINDLFCGVL